MYIGVYAIAVGTHLPVRHVYVHVQTLFWYILCA